MIITFIVGWDIAHSEITPAVASPNQLGEGRIYKVTHVLPQERINKRPLKTIGTIEEEIRKVFGIFSNIALAVATAESHLKPNAILKTPRECSVGLFQINLARNYCRGKWIHAGKVPGKTMDEKIKWLQNPINNIKIAKQIFDASGNFNPWSTYANGDYLEYLY